MTAMKKVTEASLSTLSTSAITQMYNEIAAKIGMNTVKRFADKSTAIKRALAAATAAEEAAKAEAKRLKAEAKAAGTSEPKAPREPKPQTIRNKGPRGFRVDSPAWVKSIMECKGIALLPANLPKLLDTAEVHGVDHTGKTSAEIAKMISEVMANAPAAPVAEATAEVVAE